MIFRRLLAATLAAVVLAAVPSGAAGTGPSVERPDLPAGWTVEYGGGQPHPDHPGAAALAWGPPMRHIWVRTVDSPGVLAHEAGHAWDHERLDTEDRIAWAERRGLDVWAPDPDDPGVRVFDWSRTDLSWGERPAEEFASAFRSCRGHGWHGNQHGGRAAPSPGDCAALDQMLVD